MRTFGKIILLFLICLILFGLGFLDGASRVATNFYEQQEQVAIVINTSEVTQPANPEVTQPASIAAETTPSQQSSIKNLSSCPEPQDPSEKDLRYEPVGPNHSIGDYIPINLVLLDAYVPTTTNTICLTQDAAVALKAMFSAMHKEKLYPLVASGFRDANYQEYLYYGTKIDALLPRYNNNSSNDLGCRTTGHSGEDLNVWGNH